MKQPILGVMMENGRQRWLERWEYEYWLCNALPINWIILVEPVKQND